jgi:hypothetical protein
MKRAINKGFAIHLYLDFVKNTFTIEEMAANRNINPYALLKLLEHGKELYDFKQREVKYKKAWFEHLAR